MCLQTLSRFTSACRRKERCCGKRLGFIRTYPLRCNLYLDPFPILQDGDREPKRVHGRQGSSSTHYTGWSYPGTGSTYSRYDILTYPGPRDPNPSHYLNTYSNCSRDLENHSLTKPGRIYGRSLLRECFKKRRRRGFDIPNKPVLSVGVRRR